MSNVDTGAILKEWHSSTAVIRKPKLGEACEVIDALCMEVIRLRDELDYQSKRQDLKEQQYKTMIIEIQNVVQSYV
jgi:hypothetical protein